MKRFIVIYKIWLSKVEFSFGILFFLNVLIPSNCLIAFQLDSLDSFLSKSNENNYSFSIGNWNDNFLFDKEINNLFDRNIFQTDDDFITASFWFRISKQQKLSRWFLDSYLNMATNRQLNFRTDFLSLMLNYETQLELGLLRVGSGIIFSGNFGGSGIQNFYHNMASITELNLPYSNNNHFGLSIHSLIKPILFDKNKLQIKEVTSFSLFTDGGPSSIELGLESNYTAIEDQLLFNFHLGCKSYFTLNENFESFFGKGIVWGVFSNIRIAKEVQSSFWITGNQYGEGIRNHFGISFSFLTQNLIPITFEDVKYP